MHEIYIFPTIKKWSWNSTFKNPDCTLAISVQSTLSKRTLSKPDTSLNRTANLVHSLPNCTCISVTELSLQADTSLNRTVALVPRVSALERVDCSVFSLILYQDYTDQTSIELVAKCQEVFAGTCWNMLLHAVSVSVYWSYRLCYFSGFYCDAECFFGREEDARWVMILVPLEENSISFNWQLTKVPQKNRTSWGIRCSFASSGRRLAFCRICCHIHYKIQRNSSIEL